MIRYFFLISLLVWSTASCLTQDSASAALSSDEQWMALLLDDGHAGHVQRTRSVFPDRVETTELFVLKASRNGVALSMEIEEQNTETVDGKPLSFAVVQRISGAEMRVEGVIADGQVSVTTYSAGSEQHQQFAWQPEALLREGTRLFRQRQGLAPGTGYTMTQFLASELRFVDSTTQVIGPERVDLLGTEQDLVKIIDTMVLGATSTSMVSWVNQELDEKKVRLDMMGTVFEGIACPQACATADVAPREIFAQALASAPRALSSATREGRIRYRIRADDDTTPLHFAQSDEQQVQREGSDYLVTVERIMPAAGSTASPAPQYQNATRWLQIDAPEIRQLAVQAAGNADTANLTMLHMESFVRQYVNDKNLSVGYASALEVARNRSGDCTEHALLLAALGRAAGIPTRVATGLAYVDGWLGTSHVFVPHAWTQAFIGNRWISYDAALGRFDTGHIALSYGDGEPGGFYDGINTLGNLRIIEAQSAP